MKTAKLLFLLTLIILSGCDTLDDVKKLKEEVRYYREMAAKANKQMEKYKDEIDASKEEIRKLNLDLDKAKSEINRTKELHKRMLE